MKSMKNTLPFRKSKVSIIHWKSHRIFSASRLFFFKPHAEYWNEKHSGKVNWRWRGTSRMLPIMSAIAGNEGKKTVINPCYCHWQSSKKLRILLYSGGKKRKNKKGSKFSWEIQSYSPLSVYRDSLIYVPTGPQELRRPVLVHLLLSAADSQPRR